MKKILTGLIIILSFNAIGQTVPTTNPAATPMAAKKYWFQNFVRIDSGAQVGGFLTAPTRLTSDSSDNVATTKWVKMLANPFISAPSFQQTLNTSSLLTNNNTIDGNGYRFILRNNAFLEFRQKNSGAGVDLENYTTMADTGYVARYRRNYMPGNNAESYMFLKQDSAVIGFRDTIGMNRIKITKDSALVFIDPQNTDSTKNIATTAFVKRLISTAGTGTVTGVTASAPLFSSGGTNPNITADTARANGRLSTYTQHKEDSLQIAANTIAITQRIDSLKRSSDSVFARKNGVFVFQYKDSVGSGGGGSGMAIGSPITSATAGSVLFAGTGGTLQQKNTKLYFDSTNSRLAIGNNSPYSPLTVTGNIVGSGNVRATGINDGSQAGPGAALEYNSLTGNGVLRAYDGTAGTAIPLFLAATEVLIGNSATAGSGNMLNISGTNPLLLTSASNTTATINAGTALSAQFIMTENGTNQYSFGYNGQNSGFRLYNYNVGTTLFVANSTNNVGIKNQTPAEALDVTGNIKASGTITPSDRRYKKNINSVTGAVKLLMKLQPRYYEYDTVKYPDQGFNSGKQIGLIAQEVESVVPEVVKTYPDGYKGVNYTELIPLLIKGMQEQQKEIEALKKEIIKLKKSR